MRKKLLLMALTAGVLLMGARPGQAGLPVNSGTAAKAAKDFTVTITVNKGPAGTTKVPGAYVSVTFNGITQQAIADSEGNARLTFPNSIPANNTTLEWEADFQGLEGKGTIQIRARSIGISAGVGIK